MNTALTDPKEIVMKNPDLARTRSVVQVKSLSHEKKENSPTKRIVRRLIRRKVRKVVYKMMLCNAR
jgi:hypothetical protein